MNVHLTRRGFLTAAAGAALTTAAPAEESAKPFDFVLLGDLHFDRLEHHDRDWLRREKPNDIRQVENYSRITREVLPALMAEVRDQIGGRERVPFTAHIGDFVEGLCGTPALARRHCEEAVAFVQAAALKTPFLFTKGNHDITGPGAVEAFNDVLAPFLARESGQPLSGASYAWRHGDSLFAFFDAYDPASLPWLEKTLAEPKARHVFVLIHPPVVPYSARSTWHVYARPGQQAERTRLLNLLGKRRAIVLCGHIHKYGAVVRRTEDDGAFVQLAVNSVIPTPGIAPKDTVSGRSEYGPEMVRLEPNFSPDTVEERREYLKAEAPFVTHFEYADAPGYAVVSVREARVTADLYAGLGRRRWRTLDLTELLAQKA